MKKDRRLKVEDLLRSWEIDVNLRVEYENLISVLEYIAPKVFDQYVPTEGPGPNFMARLSAWLQNVAAPEDQMLLLSLVRHLTFVSKEQMTSLYRAAHNGPIRRTQVELAWEDETFTKDMLVSPRVFSDDIWFCGITDSMDISNFYHANNLEGRTHRPAWQTLAKFGDQLEIKRFVEDNGINLVVLLEDFVGSGDQMSSIARHAAITLPELKVLVVPLICCQPGYENGRRLASSLPNLLFEPVHVVSYSVLLAARGEGSEPRMFPRFRELAKRTYPMVVGHHAGSTDEGYLGYSKTGSLLVLYSNTPDNTLPLIHWTSDSWRALFPRSSRT